MVPIPTAIVPPAKTHVGKTRLASLFCWLEVLFQSSALAEIIDMAKNNPRTIIDLTD